MTHRMAPDLASESAWFKSSYSSENATNCVEVAWIKSSYSGDTGNNCVEVGAMPATREVAVRDSKDKSGPALLFPAEAFAAFVAAVRDGELPA